MQTESSNGHAERRVLIACITSSEFLGRVVGKPGRDPFRSKWSNLLYSWCSSYYQEHHSAPGKDIESLFESWAHKSQDKDTYRLVERFLSSLSREAAREEPQKVDFLLDLAEKHLNEVRLEKLQEELKLRTERGETEDAWSEISRSQKINLRASPRIDVLRDLKSQKSALDSKQKVLVRYPGAAGEFFGEELSEDSFVAFMAAAKGGKSWALLDVAWRAMRQGRKVAYFQIGDLSEGQVMRRFLKRAAYRPFTAKTFRYPVSIVAPSERGETAHVEHIDRSFELPMIWKQARRAFARIASKAKGEIGLSCHAIKTVSVTDIKAILKGWDQEGWEAKVVVIDYAGNLAPVDGKSNPVEQTSLTWAMMRQLSELRKCLVVTANQSNKEGFRSWVLTRNHFSESKYVLAHVTSFLGINMTDEEKAFGILRYNFVVRREDEFNETKCLYCAPCLEVSSPIVLSTLPT